MVYSLGKSISVAEPQDLFEQKFTLDASTQNTIDLQLTGLKAGTLYYFIIKPTNKDGISGDFSTEGSFTTLGNTPSNIPAETPDASLGAPSDANANFTYAVSGSNVTLTWNASAAVTMYQFSLKNINDTDYKSLGNAKATDQKFSFVVSKVGSYNVKIVGMDANGNTVGSERILNVKVDTISNVPGKGTPQTGPGLNIILMSTFLMMLIYVVYKFRGAK